MWTKRQTDGEIDMKKLIAAFRNIANAPESIGVAITFSTATDILFYYLQDCPSSKPNVFVDIFNSSSRVLEEYSKMDYLCFLQNLHILASQPCFISLEALFFLQFVVSLTEWNSDISKKKLFKK
jgi:hypothetical protein